MSYIDGQLGSGEHVVFRTKRHPAVLMFPIIGIALAITVFGPSGFGLLLTVLAACWLAVGLAAHGASEFCVTNRRVLIRTGGVLSRRTVDTSLRDVADVDVTQSGLGGKIGYGTVTVRGTDGSTGIFPTLQHPLTFRDRVQEQQGRLAPSDSRSGR